MAASPPVNFGSAGTLTRDTPLILRDFVGAKINLVRGVYRHRADTCGGAA